MGQQLECRCKLIIRIFRFGIQRSWIFSIDDYAFLIRGLRGILRRWLFCRRPCTLRCILCWVSLTARYLRVPKPLQILFGNIVELDRRLVAVEDHWMFEAKVEDLTKIHAQLDYLAKSCSFIAQRYTSSLPPCCSATFSELEVCIPPDQRLPHALTFFGKEDGVEVFEESSRLPHQQSGSPNWI